jgi:hypothetical protein
MASPVTLGTMVLRARRRANLEGALQFIPDEEAIDYVNTGIAAWWDLVSMTTFAGQIARIPWPIVTVNNQSLYPLAPNHLRLISVDVTINGQTLAINSIPYQEEQRNIFKAMPFVGWSAFGGVCQSIWYQLQGTSINFIPTPPSGTTLTANYFPVAPRLAKMDDDSLNSINGWEEWIVLQAARRMLIKDGQLEMAGALMPLLAEETQRIQACAAQADLNGAEGVHETEAYGNYGPGFSYPW